MLAAWILGSLFFVFIISFILYISATDVSQREPAGQSHTETASPLVNESVAHSGKCLISRDYLVVLSPRVFIDYPFGIRVVFARPGTSAPATTCRLAETNGNPRSNLQRVFRESEYYGWPQSALEDPELTVIGGRIEFESEEVSPTIRVELKSGTRSFQAIETAAERVLSRERDTVFSFWLNPLKAETGSFKLVVSHMSRAAGTAVAASNGKASHELAAIPLTVVAVSFPIALR
jgi:hypothetical protein